MKNSDDFSHNGADTGAAPSNTCLAGANRRCRSRGPTRSLIESQGRSRRRQRGGGRRDGHAAAAPASGSRAPGPPYREPRTPLRAAAAVAAPSTPAGRSAAAAATSCPGRRWSSRPMGRLSQRERVRVSKAGGLPARPERPSWPLQREPESCGRTEAAAAR